MIPGMGLKQPKGIRSVVEWYMSTAMRQDYLHQVFEKEIDIAIANYEKLWAALGDKIDVVLTWWDRFRFPGITVLLYRYLP